jgi:hypothetical protein
MICGKREREKKRKKERKNNDGLKGLLRIS